jgi:hypothetical protein
LNPKPFQRSNPKQGDLDRFYSPKQALELGDPSVYTGAGGVALMYLRLAALDAPYFAEQRDALIAKAESYSQVALLCMYALSLSLARARSLSLSPPPTHPPSLSLSFSYICI